MSYVIQIKTIHKFDRETSQTEGTNKSVTHSQCPMSA